MTNIKDIPKEVLNTIKTLQNNDFEAFIVGGCVRDLLLNITPEDWDITTNAKPENIISLFSKTFYENKWGTVSVVNEETQDEKLKVIEITPYRTEGKYSDLRHPDEVKFSDHIEDDLKRRDFTINAIAYDPIKDIIIDPHKGQKDIKDKILTAVGDAYERISEDPLRAIRAIRLASKLGFAIEPNTVLAIQKAKNLIETVSRERIGEEFRKLILSKNPSIGLALAQKIGILDCFSKHLTKMVDVLQNKEAHKYDVWEHSLRTLQYSADSNFNLEIRLAAFLHDISKPETKRENSGKTTFYGHEVVGTRVTREILNDLRFSHETIEKVSKLVRWHMFFTDTEVITLSAIRRLVRNVGPENIWDLMDLRKCDRIGTGRPKAEPYRLRKYQSMIEEALRDPISVSMLKIDGNVLIELGIEKGRLFGQILNILLDEVLEDPKLNIEKNLKERAIEISKMDTAEIEKLAKKAKEANKMADDDEVSSIRDRFHVK